MYVCRMYVDVCRAIVCGRGAGQTRPTRVIRIIAEDSIDQDILAYQASILPFVTRRADGTVPYRPMEAGPLVQAAKLTTRTLLEYFVHDDDD